MRQLETKVARETTVLLMCFFYFLAKIKHQGCLTHQLSILSSIFSCRRHVHLCAKSFPQKNLVTTHNFPLHADGLTKNFSSGGSRSLTSLSCDFLVTWYKDGGVNCRLSSVIGADKRADNSPNSGPKNVKLCQVCHHHAWTKCFWFQTFI